MKLPKVVYPCGVPFKVEIEKLPPGDMGQTLGTSRSIKLSNSEEHEEHLTATLFHEYLHAIFYVSGLSELVGHRQEEAIVTAMENSLRHVVNFSKLGKKQ